MSLLPAASKDCCCLSLQILGNGMDTGDTLPSVLLFFDKHRCAARSQCSCTQPDLNMRPVTHLEQGPLLDLGLILDGPMPD